jgi:DNA gyrase/topoisomerase IV subunit B
MNSNLNKGVVDLSTQAIKKIDDLIKTLNIEKSKFQEMINNSESEDLIEAFDHAVNDVDYYLRVAQSDFRFVLRMLVTDLNYFINNSEGGLK